MITPSPRCLPDRTPTKLTARELDLQLDADDSRLPMSINPSANWSVGQKVVCVNDAFPHAVLDWCDFLPRAGCVYTIRAIQLGVDGVTRLPSLGFLLEEFVNPPSSLGKEAGFDVSRFEPWLASDLETNHATDEINRPRIGFAA
jgi:hypothetical protein